MSGLLSGRSVCHRRAMTFSKRLRTPGGKYNSPLPRFRSVKSVADTRLVEYLTKCQRFLRGSLRILFSARLDGALNQMTLPQRVNVNKCCHASRAGLL